MNVSPRAARQLQARDPGDAATILDQLRQRSYGPGSHLVEITIAPAIFRCFVARHRDHSLVLLGMVSARARDGPVARVL